MQTRGAITDEEHFFLLSVERFLCLSFDTFFVTFSTLYVSAGKGMRKTHRQTDRQREKEEKGAGLLSSPPAGLNAMWAAWLQGLVHQF